MDSEAGVSEFVYDGLGRRVQHRRADGSVRDFAFSPVGLLAQVSDDGASVVRLWNDALSQTAGVAGADGSVPCELVWDLAAGVPTVLGAGGVPVSLAVGVGVDVLGARGVDPFGVSPVVWGFGSGVAGGVSVAGSVQVAGLEVLGVRAYDAVSRGFLSPDPVASPVGAGWGANVYCFVGNAPTAMVDPWGLSPMSAAQFREYREDVSGRVVERLGKGLADFVDQHAGAIAAGVAVVGVGLVIVSGPIGWGILSGMAISGGMELGSQLLSGQPLNWKKIAKSASIGGIAGGFGAGVASLVTKVGSKAFTSIASRYSTKASAVNQQISQVFRKVATNPATKNAVPKIVTGLKRTQQGLMSNAQRFSSAASRMGSSGVREGIAAYAEAGMETTLTYVTDGHHVTAGGLAQAWGVPAVSNAMVPKVSGRVDNILRRAGWDAASNVGDNVVRKFIADRVADFGNGVTDYTAAPMTYSEKYESYREPGYDGPGWRPDDALSAGFRESVKGTVNGSAPVQSLKSPSFNGWTGLAGDSLFTGVAAPVGGEVAEAGKHSVEEVFGDGQE